MKTSRFFVSAIGTDSGKSLVSAILTEALEADYWKPVQSGAPADTDTVRHLVSNPYSRFHPEAYRFSAPLSPHAAAAAENRSIVLEHIQVPDTKNHLVIEGAGGLLVPLNTKDFVIDLALRFQATLILVADLYLGSINHTLLSLKLLQHYEENYGLRLGGIIFNKGPVPASEEIIMQHAKIPCLLSLPAFPQAPNAAVVQIQAKFLKKQLVASGMLS